MLHVISLGAGVQSTTMALMAAAGEITPMPDCAIFADTGWEPRAVYQHLAWLREQLPFPVHVVSGGNLRSDLLARHSARSGDRFIGVPFFVRHGNGKEGMGRRQCTSHYKVEPIQRQMRAMLGKKPRQRIAPGSIAMWVGISVDEIMRATPSKERWINKRFPLLEQAMRRNDCLAWLRRQSYPEPPKSACLGCPFHNHEQWVDLKRRPEEWADTVIVDEAIRAGTGYVSQQFMHRQRVPLDQVDLSTAEDRGQLNLFLNECEGMCGV